MKKASLIVEKALQNDKIFDLNDSILTDEHCVYGFCLLRDEFKKNGYILSTQDINKISESEIIIYYEIPDFIPQIDNNYKSYLIMLKNEFRLPIEWELDIHYYFTKIFTWEDDIIDNSKYFKINYPHNTKKEINKDLLKKQKLCTLIGSNKKLKHPLELYSKRKEAIKWFERNHLNDFDFYGKGWDTYNVTNSFVKFLFSKFNLSKYFKPNFLNYKGLVDERKIILEKYRFSICYDSKKNVSGYINRKIFDCFFAGCVPIYWGANNIQDYIPEKCFIDKRKFDSYEDLYNFLKYMSDRQYLEYLKNIEFFLNSSRGHKFESEYFVETIVKTIFE